MRFFLPASEQAERGQNSSQRASHYNQDIPDGSPVGPPMIFTSHLRLSRDFADPIFFVIFSRRTPPAAESPSAVSCLHWRAGQTLYAQSPLRVPFSSPFPPLSPPLS